MLKNELNYFWASQRNKQTLKVLENGRRKKICIKNLFQLPTFVCKYKKNLGFEMFTTYEIK